MALLLSCFKVKAGFVFEFLEFCPRRSYSDMCFAWRLCEHQNPRLDLVVDVGRMFLVHPVVLLIIISDVVVELFLVSVMQFAMLTTIYDAFIPPALLAILQMLSKPRTNSSAS